MRDQEINEAVARKLGWIQSKVFIDPVPMWEFPDKNVKGSIFTTNRLPDYCRDIKAAWEIITDHCDEWHLDCRSGVSVRLQKNYVSGFAEADSAPMAICLAFLKLGA